MGGREGGRRERRALCLTHGFSFSDLYRILTMDRAQLGGLDDVGIGALFGLAG